MAAAATCVVRPRPVANVPLLTPFDANASDAARLLRRPYRVVSVKDADCSHSSDEGGASSSSYVLLVGVMSGPANVACRDAIRRSWMHSADGVVVAFVVGTKGMRHAQLASLRAESDANRGDLWLLPDVADGCAKAVTIAKAHGWWRAADAARAGRRGPGRGGPLFVAKTDDDTYLALSPLVALLGRVKCRRHVYFGAHAFAGYHPTLFRKCGFAWGGPGAFHKYKCAEAGAHPPFPFAIGQLEVLSSRVVHRIASSPGIAEFADAAEASFEADEDSALGYLLSRAYPPPEAPPAANRTPAELAMHASGLLYVGLSSRQWHNLGCGGGSSGKTSKNLYRMPRNGSSLVVHRLHTPRQMAFVHGILSGANRTGRDAVTCLRETTAKSRGQLTSFCRRCARKATWEASACLHAPPELVAASCARHGLLDG